VKTTRKRGKDHDNDEFGVMQSKPSEPSKQAILHKLEEDEHEQQQQQQQQQDRQLQKQQQIRRDTVLEFGSTAAAKGRAKELLGGDDDDDGDYMDEEEEYDREQRERQRVVQELLKEQDEEFKEERRKMVWGEFAGAKTKEDIDKVKQSIKEKIDKENQIKAMVARQQHGVELEILDLPDSVDGGSVFDDNGNVQIKAGSSGGKKWYDEMDEDLKQEWEAMEGGTTVGPAYQDGDELDYDGDDDDDDDQASTSADTIEVNGKIVSRDTLKGVRVGSAGGWTLEVFPGDFVVHRKYGIGRFERTCLLPKTKLTEDEIQARDARRKELLAMEIKKIRGGVTRAQIQDIHEKFGTEEDTDPISNPQTMVLEISYKDGIVHVPIDRAYRLSRYRAGDSIVKPRLSKVRGDQWKNARRKVEETTLELAQDVLALYATRETLTRKPFDPALEFLVKDFETTFPFEPTKDQQKCFEDVENDMVWRSRPMDRLVCGDVGYVMRNEATLIFPNVELTLSDHKHVFFLLALEKQKWQCVLFIGQLSTAVRLLCLHLLECWLLNTSKILLSVLAKAPNSIKELHF
jgi:transcription-repair coupling factor (superfamily II helicase)